MPQGAAPAQVLRPDLGGKVVLDLDSLRRIASAADIAPVEGDVVLVLDALDSVDAPARALTGLFRRLARPHRRLAVVVPRARVRGALLAAAHASGAEGVKVVASEDVAAAWFGGGPTQAARTEAALAEIRERLSRVKGVPPRKG